MPVQLPPSTSGKPARGSVQTRARKSTSGQLASLREALHESAATQDSWDARKASLVAGKLAQLQTGWKATDGAKPARKTQSLGKGIRRLPDAIEYDYSIIDDDSSDDEPDGPDLQNTKLLPREVRYFDTAAINICSGSGGNGCCAFRREKYVSHGGPSGGNGGNGGAVWVIAEEGMNSLTTFRNRVHWKADSGVPGQGKSQHGANSQDMYIKVPPGTIVREKDMEDLNGPPIAELLTHGDKALVAQGGRGGRGNQAFKTSQNRAPTIAEHGEEGLEMWITLELKLVADVGIIGVPNCGKSTLLSVLSSAKPKIANYAFTTLVPNLGVCELDYQTTVFADVPGLVEGAHSGEGLGHEFLRHVSRARTLVHVIDGTSADPIYDYRAIRLELQLFDGALEQKPQLIAYNKIDLPDSGEYVDDVKELLAEQCGVAPSCVYPISSAAGEGVLDLVRAVRRMLVDMPPEPVQLTTDARNQQIKVKSSVDSARLSDFTIEAELDKERVWYVRGLALERFSQMTNWDYFEATLRFQRVLQAVGLWEALERKGVLPGDSVVIGEAEFVWHADRSEGKLYESWLNGLNASKNPGRGSARWPHMAG